MKIVNPYSEKKISIGGVSEMQSISFFDYLFVFMLIIYAGRANTFVESGSFTDNAIGFLLPVVLSTILALRWKIKFDQNFFLLLWGFSIYFIAISIKVGEVHPSFLIHYTFKFFTAYTAIKALKSNLFKIFEYLLYYLAIVALFMWIVQIGLGGDTLYYIFNRIPGMASFSYVTGNGATAIIYSVQPVINAVVNLAIPRNCGYTQEPGSFAVLLCLAIFVNLFITTKDKNSKRRFWIFVVALISTQSTTGYVIFMVIILFYILSKNLSKVLLLFPIAIVALIYVSTLPFMSNKIVDLLTETNTLDQLIIRSFGAEETFTPQRFTSFVITFKDFQANPILGLGPDNEDSWLLKIGARISPISGVGTLLAQFGLVGFFFFIFFSLKSSFFFAKYFNYTGKFLLFFIIILISISYFIFILPMIMSFWLFQLFAPQEVKQKEVDGLVLNTETKLVNP
jgi:hypothetical protein